MRKLKPQVQSTVDGFIGGPDGAMDTMVRMNPRGIPCDRAAIVWRVANSMMFCYVRMPAPPLHG